MTNRTGKGASWFLLSVVCLFQPAPASALTGKVLDARQRTPVASAEVTIVGQRGSARTDADGRFDWPLTTALPMVVVVILPDGRVARPIHLEALDGANSVTLMVEAAVTEALDISGAAPTIEVSAGASTSLVTGADARLRHPATLGQTLENVPGVSVISEGQSATPAIRGLARGRTTIMVDGSRASSERRAGPNASFLDPGIIERVEVARGPGSVAYGSDAMGGVIAVRTRRPDFRAPIQARFAGTLGGGVPEVRGEVELSAGYGNGGILAGVRTREFDDYESPAGEVANSGWSDRGLRLRWDHGTGSAMWSIGWQSDQGRDIGRARSDSEVVRVTTPSEDSHRLTMSYQRESLAGFRRVRFEGMAGSIRQRTDQDRLATTNRARSVEQSEVGSRDVQVRATGDRIVGGARVQIGADVDARYGLESTDTVVSYNLAGAAVSSLATPSIEHAHRTNAGMFTQIDMQAAPRLRLSGGLRGDLVHSANTGGYFGDREIAHSAVAGSAAVTVALVRSLSVTAQLSRGFREPMLSDRFYRGPVGRGFIEGNPDLEPETSRQIDVTARYDTGRLSLLGAFYDYRISNLIERYQSGTTNFFYRNRGAARLRGVEAEARAALPLGFSISATGQFSRGRDDHDHTPIDDIAPESVSLVTRHRLGAVTSYFRVAQFASHTAAGPSEVPTPGYSLLDAGAGWRIHERLQVLGVMRNLLNDRFYSSAGPRWVYAPGRHGSVTILVEF